MIKVLDAGKGYNRVMAVQNMNITVNKGEIHGIVGSNGAGKTTLLKCLAGIYRTDEGKVLYDDKEIYDMPETKQRVAYVSDNQEFISIYSIAGIIKLYENFYEDFSVIKFDELNKKFGLNKKKTIGNLSKGQKTKLAFMLAIAQRAEYLIMDEPESGLDVESQKHFKDILIEEVERRELGVIISSHNLSGIEQICDSLTIMEKGRSIWQGSLDELMGSVQKWQAIWSDAEVPKGLKNPKLSVCGQIGKMTEFYTMGDRDENTKLLLESGAEELEGKQITLEEIYCLVKKEKTE